MIDADCPGGAGLGSGWRQQLTDVYTGGVRLPGRTVVVTGAGTGIGRAISATFAADGDVVVLLGRRPGVLAQAADEIGRRAPDRVRWRRCDVSDPAQVDSFWAWLTGEVSQTLDVLVNNAGGRAGYSGALPPGST